MVTMDVFIIFHWGRNLFGSLSGVITWHRAVEYSVSDIYVLTFLLVPIAPLPLHTPMAHAHYQSIGLLSLNVTSDSVSPLTVLVNEGNNSFSNLTELFTLAGDQGNDWKSAGVRIPTSEGEFNVSLHAHQCTCRLRIRWACRLIRFRISYNPISGKGRSL